MNQVNRFLNHFHHFFCTCIHHQTIGGAAAASILYYKFFIEILQQYKYIFMSNKYIQIVKLSSSLNNLIDFSKNPGTQTSLLTEAPGKMFEFPQYQIRIPRVSFFYLRTFALRFPQSFLKGRGALPFQKKVWLHIHCSRWQWRSHWNTGNKLFILFIDFINLNKLFEMDWISGFSMSRVKIRSLYLFFYFVRCFIFPQTLLNNPFLTV